MKFCFRDGRRMLLGADFVERRHHAELHKEKGLYLKSWQMWIQIQVLALTTLWSWTVISKILMWIDVTPTSEALEKDDYNLYNVMRRKLAIKLSV